MARTPSSRRTLRCAVLATPLLFGFGYVLDDQRLQDTTPVFALDRDMDARIGAYVPFVRAAKGRFGSERELAAHAEAWRRGRIEGRLRDPMPPRYGDSGDGARAEIVYEAVCVSGKIASAARRHGTTDRARRLFAASLEPLRTVQYADVATFTKVASRRSWVEGTMRQAGFDEGTVRRTTSVLRPDRTKLDGLLRHMARLRNQFRVRFSDEDLWNADPYFERLVQGGEDPFRRLASR